MLFWFEATQAEQDVENRKKVSLHDGVEAAHELLLAKLSRSNKDKSRGGQNLADHVATPIAWHGIR